MDQSLEYKIGVMQALLAGQTIEASRLYAEVADSFFETADPSWNWNDFYYRVKRKPKSWKDAVIDKLVACCIYTNEHETNPEKAVSDLLTGEISRALDPLISEKAQKLLETVPAGLLDKTFIVWCDETEGLSEQKLRELLPLVDFPGKMVLRWYNGLQTTVPRVDEGEFWKTRRDMKTVAEDRNWYDYSLEFHFTLKHS